MKVRKILGRTAVAASLCVGALAARPAPAQALPPQDVVEAVCAYFFGGTFFTTVNGFGCLLPNGDMYICDQFSCYWLPAPRTVDRDPHSVALPPDGGVALDTTPLGDGYQPVVALDAAADMTLAQVGQVASLTAGSRFEGVGRVLIVEGGADLSGTQIEALLNGRAADGIRLVRTITDPAPDTRIGEVSTADRQRVLAIDANPRLTLIVLR